jgi:hypothetical protein
MQASVCTVFTNNNTAKITMAKTWENEIEI